MNLRTVELAAKSVNTINKSALELYPPVYNEILRFRDTPTPWTLVFMVQLLKQLIKTLNTATTIPPYVYIKVKILSIRKLHGTYIYKSKLNANYTLCTSNKTGKKHAKICTAKQIGK